MLLQAGKVKTKSWFVSNAAVKSLLGNPDLASHTIMYFLHRFLLLLSSLPFIARCVPIEDAFPTRIKGLESCQSGFACFSDLFHGRALEAGLPPVHINTTPNLSVYCSDDDIPWTNGGNIRNHRWR